MRLVVLLALLLSLVLAFPSHAGLTFTATSYETGVVARWVGVADFNEDGNPDLVISQPDSSRLVFLFGKGDGTFPLRRVLSFDTVKLHGLVQTPPLAGATGDLNGDGHADLVFTTYSGILVLLGKGDGTFQSIQTYPMLSPPSALWSEPLSLHIADLDGDGKPDLIFPDGWLHVMWQGSQGTFGPESSYVTTGYDPDDVALGDFNNDGLLDVATSDRGHSMYGWYVSVFLNHGNRALGPETRYGATYSPMSIFATDLDGNGSLDLLAAGQEGDFSPLLNDGSGSFQSAPLTTLVGGLYGAALADLDQDGLPDLAIPSDRQLLDGSWTNCVYIERGLGNGRFATAATSDMSTNQWMVTTADLNHDALPDIVTWYDGITVFLNQTSIVAAPPPHFALSFETPQPNPARSKVSFDFSLPENSATNLAIFDLAGRLVTTLASGRLGAGPHQATWDLRSNSGRAVAAGVYFARLSMGRQQMVRRVEVLH